MLEDRRTQGSTLRPWVNVQMLKKQAIGLVAHHEDADSLALVQYVPRDAWIECVHEARSRSHGVEPSGGLKTWPHCSNPEVCERWSVFGLGQLKSDGTHRCVFV
jgi:hypothetical protein